MLKSSQWKRYLVILLACFLAFWITDAAIDALTFREGPFIDELLSMQPRELYMRTFMSSIVAVVLVLVSALGERRQKVETALEQYDQLSSIFFMSSSDAICVVDAARLTLIDGNAIFFSRYGLSAKESLGRGIVQLAASSPQLHDISGQVRECARSKSAATRESSSLTSLSRDGLRHFEEVSTHVIADPQQGTEMVLVVSRDITVRRNSEAALRESEARYRAIFDNTGTALAVIRSDGVLHMANRGFEAITGCTREELEGKRRWTEFISGGGANPVLDQLKDQDGAAEGRQSIELQTVDRHGVFKSMAGNWAAISGTDQAVLSLVDVTAQKEVEQALRESQATLAVAQRIAHLGNWEWDVVTDTITWSEELYRIFEVDPSTFTPTFDFFLQIVHPDDREMIIRSVNDALYNKKPYNVYYRLVVAGGGVRTLLGRAEVTYDAAGNPLRMIGTNQDITWRTEAEEALRISEEKFSKAFRASPDSIVITRADDGMYIDVNQAFQDITGYSREEVIGKTAVELKLWADPNARMVMLRILNQSGHVRNLDVRFRVKSGEIRELLWSAEVIEYRGEACLIAISRDVTEQRHLERELLESDARLFMKHEELKKLFQQMEGIRREWEETMDCISDMFILADQWGKIRRFNRAVEIFTGKAHRDIVGRDWVALLEDYGLKPHLQAPGVELPHEVSGKRYVLNRYAFPTADIDGSTREVVIINDTTAIRLRRPTAPLRLARKGGGAH